MTTAQCILVVYLFLGCITGGCVSLYFEHDKVLGFIQGFFGYICVTSLIGAIILAWYVFGG